MSRTNRVEVVTIVAQTVLNGQVAAVNTKCGKRAIYRRRDGTEYIRVKGKQVELIRGVALL